MLLAILTLSFVLAGFALIKPPLEDLSHVADRHADPFSRIIEH